MLKYGLFTKFDKGEPELVDTFNTKEAAHIQRRCRAEKAHLGGYRREEYVEAIAPE